MDPSCGDRFRSAAGAHELDESIVVSAAWLHDIGYSSATTGTGFHPIDGARYLRARDWDETVCRLVAHHSDAASQVPTRHLGDQLRAEFPEVVGLARDVLWTADVTTGPSGQRCTLDERIAEIGERYGWQNCVTQRMIASKPLLEEAIDRVSAARIVR